MKKLTLAAALLCLPLALSIAQAQDEAAPADADAAAAEGAEAAGQEAAATGPAEGTAADEGELAASEADAGEATAEAMDEFAEALIGDAAAGGGKSAVCAACHGTDGKALQPNYPNLAGQSAGYIAKQLTDYREGNRVNALMSGQAANLSDQDIVDLAAYYSAMEKIGGVAEEENLALGERIYRGGIPAADVPACSGCHGPAGLGNPAALFPLLSGQNTAYTADQLRYFRSGERNNDPNRVMRSIAHRLTDAEIDAVANYIAGLYADQTVAASR